MAKTGKCLDCPADYIQHPQNPKDCIYGKYVKQVRCKRGYRVDQLSIENFAGVKKLSHTGFAGGAWRSGRQELTLESGEYIARVDAYHITRGFVKNQLSKIVYFTSKRRVVACYYSRVRYRTSRTSFKAPDGEYIQMINQYKDKRKCCGRVTSVDTEKFAKSKDEALNDAIAAKCKPNQYLKITGDTRACAACPRGKVRSSENSSQCIKNCPEYTYIDSTGDKCVKDVCSQFEKLGKDGKCLGCGTWKNTDTRQLEAAAAAKPVANVKVALRSARQSSTWPRRYRGNWLSADKAIDTNINTFSHTRMGRGHWWVAYFKTGNMLVKEVKVLNRRDCCGDRLRDVTVYVGRYYCGKLPNKTYTGKWYTVTCSKPVTGSSVIFRQNTFYTALQLTTVEVYGDDNCSHNEGKNSWGAHRCRSSSDCSGRRYCSRYRWCHGTSGCPKVTKVVAAVRESHKIEAVFKGQQCAASKMDDPLGKEGFKSATECASVAKSELNCNYFNFDTNGGKCSCCSTIDGRGQNSRATIYKLVPNLPAYL